MTDLITQKEFNSFVSYMRKMLADIAGAKTGSYINADHMQEAAISWNPGEGPGIDGHPLPDNITKIEVEPYANTIDCGNYHFKEVLCRLIAATGLNYNEEPLISGTKPGHFDCTMHSGCVDGPGDELADAVFIVFIRANSADLKPRLESLKDIDEQTLRETCRKVLEDKNYRIENTAGTAAAKPIVAP